MKNSHVKVRVDALATGGACIGEVTGTINDNEDSPLVGRKSFVRFVLPGEDIVVKPTKIKKRFIEAQLSEVISPSPYRVEPPCPHFQKCGGCSLQHIDLQQQRALKRDMVESMLLRQGGITSSEGVRLATSELEGYHYRNRITLRFDRKGRPGFLAHKSKSVVPVKKCLIASKPINQTLQSISVLPSSLRGRISNLELRQANSAVIGLFTVARNCSKEQVSAEAAFFQKLSPCRVQRITGEVLFEAGFEQLENTTSSPGHFAQVNTEANQQLRELVNAELHSSESVLELYAGSGNLSFLLASAGVQVTAVEASEQLVQDGNSLATQQGLPISFIHARAEEAVQKVDAPTTLLLDPPRAGALDALEALDCSKLQKVLYVSCDLATLTRDLSYLQSLGFETKKVSVVDMFPQTSHVECVVVLERP